MVSRVFDGAKEVHGTKAGCRFGRQTEGDSCILIDGVRCNGSFRSVGRHVVDKVPLWVGGAKRVLICSVDDHTHEVFWIDEDLRAKRTSMVTMQP